MPAENAEKIVSLCGYLRSFVRYRSKSRFAPVTPVEALLEEGDTELDDWLSELLEKVAPLRWLRSEAGWAGQGRAVAICEHLAANAEAAAALGIEAEGWVMRGSLLHAMYVTALTLAWAGNRVVETWPTGWPLPCHFRVGRVGRAVLLSRASYGQQEKSWRRWCGPGQVDACRNISPRC